MRMAQYSPEACATSENDNGMNPTGGNTMKPKALTLACAALLTGAMTATAFADDGDLFRRQTSSPPGETMDPEPEGEHAAAGVFAAAGWG